eukprot:6812675-Pyramimonas_sp.AAC.1
MADDVAPSSSAEAQPGDEFSRGESPQAAGIQLLPTLQSHGRVVPCRRGSDPTAGQNRPTWSDLVIEKPPIVQG